MKILSVLFNQFGSSYYRQYVPMRAMGKADYQITIVDTPNVPTGTLHAHDVVQFSRVAGTDSTQAVDRIKWLQNMGLKVVIDYDDDLLHIPAHNPAYTHTSPQAVIDAVQVADAITVTSEALRAVYKPYAKHIGVIPNYMDVANWPHAPERSGITIGLVGSPSHHEDWRLIAEPMRRIREQYDVQFLVAGYMPDYLEGIATEYVGWQDVFAYQDTVNRIDIGLCPLLDDPFNRRKTPIKAMEYALAGAAVVASPTLYRDMVQGRGTIARTEDEWFQAIERYITNEDLAMAHASALHTYVTTRWDVRKHVADIHSTYRSLFKASQRPIKADLTGSPRTRKARKNNTGVPFHGR